jgi:hypothetical protein
MTRDERVALPIACRRGRVGRTQDTARRSQPARHSLSDETHGCDATTSRFRFLPIGSSHLPAKDKHHD